MKIPRLLQLWNELKGKIDDRGDGQVWAKVAEFEELLKSS